MALNPAQIALLMARLPEASQRAIDFLAKTKGKTPEEVFQECLREYIAGRIPQVDVSAALDTTHTVMYNAGFAFGRIRSLARAWQKSRDED
ncbi:MAG: hypothetical protein MR009_03690 [Sutterellaceae bacterium]|nr:hypothetical protein [Sutterellaceae bacterium]MDD7441351.1 hypothetical protein [Sutterellaceae bacterium]MDY2869033.1 hypothetical protein [Mesosutterella sp.]